MSATATHTHSRSIGAVLWILSIQYYVVQLVVASSWAKGSGYSWASNTISDLANTRCGLYGGRFVCSPLHAAMNISFVVLSITMISGAYFLQKQLAGKRFAKLGFGCMAAAGIGTILVGLFPENSVSQLHIIGAALSFVFGNLGMIIIGIRIARLPNWLRAYSVLSGVVGLIALILFQANSYIGLGVGGVERFVGYPQSVWMIIFGAYILVSTLSFPRASQD